MGKAGRELVIKRLAELKESLRLDFIIVNGENSAHGFGITPQIAEDFFKSGADVITTGNHAFNKKELVPFLERNPYIIRPYNFPSGVPGKGFSVISNEKGQKVLVIQLMGRLFMPENVDCPFQKLDEILASYNLGRNIDAIIVDFHAEASSEKMSFGWYASSRVSLVAGTHTHVPTNDAMIWNGTGYITDAGMCGCFKSVIGMDKSEPILRFTKALKNEHFTPSNDGEASLCGVIIETDNKTGLCKNISSFIEGGELKKVTPCF